MSTAITGIPLNQVALVNRVTGDRIYEDADLRQSIIVILTTPIGTRVMRRDFGSNLFKMLDRNIDRTINVRLINAVATPLYKWEPRIRVKKVQIKSVNASAGTLRFDLHYRYMIDGKEVGGTHILKDITLDFYSENRYDLIKPQ